MINRIHFGKRIATIRRELKLSQSELSERLGVTPQAVSKWERGAALPDIDILIELSHLFNVSINDLLEDQNLIFELTGKDTLKNGIAFFTSENEQDCNSAGEKEILNKKLIAKNWNNAMLRNDIFDSIGKYIADQGGIILEIGAGPGGGFVPYILKANSDATVIISDILPTVVKEWKVFLDNELGSPNLFYAVFDFCNMPFKDNSVDIVSDGGGIGNAMGDKLKALKEAYRILKPGGLLVTSTGFVNKETLSEIPKETQTALMQKRPDIFEDLYEDTVLAGFTKIDSIIGDGWYTDDDDSTIAVLARSLGINLKFTGYIRYCTK